MVGHEPIASGLLVCPAVRVSVAPRFYPGSRHGAARVQDRRIDARSKETA